MICSLYISIIEKLSLITISYIKVEVLEPIWCLCHKLVKLQVSSKSRKCTGGRALCLLGRWAHRSPAMQQTNWRAIIEFVRVWQWKYWNEHQNNENSTFLMSGNVENVLLHQGWPTQNTPRATWDVDNLDRATLH